MDAKTIHEHFKPNSFDRILVDAPCSGLGLMRRKPDIKYQKTVEDFKQLPKIQLQILKSAASVLKSNGRLVYSTCTIAPEENQGVVMQFLQENPDFSLVAPEIFAHLPQSVHNQMLTIYPYQYQTDGFFIAVLEKK
ncbi:16S rRNA (cytosine(967)-C(5))-methyltransferase RsmB [Enterococcus cecorum]|nr:16S rRNA (cytosine(967)-C(5))-methyltransferase RsmB [Enterococcus cecorum]